jgi:hypothetical protein
VAAVGLATSLSTYSGQCKVLRACIQMIHLRDYKRVTEELICIEGKSSHGQGTQRLFGWKCRQSTVPSAFA